MTQETIMMLAAGILLILAAVLLIMMKKSNTQEALIKELINDHKSMSELQRENDELQQKMNILSLNMSQQLFQFESTISSSMKDDFHRLNESTVNRLVSIEKQVNQSLHQGFDKNNEAFMKVMEQMARLDAAQKSLDALSKDIAGLQGILTDKKTRGTFGEVQLYTLLENVFGSGSQFYRKQVHLSNGTIADCVIKGPEALNDIVVDSKFPLENYNRMIDSTYSAVQQNRYRSEFRKDVAKHIKDIAQKYLIEGETAEFACMFIPSEAVFSVIAGQFDDLLQLGYSLHVYLVSPSTLMAYLTAIQAIYLDQKRNEKVKEIRLETIQLSKEFERFKERWITLEKDFEKTWKDMQQLSITASKLTNRFEKIENAEIEDN